MAQWFKLQGSPPGNPLDPLDYVLDGTPSCGSGTNSICAIQAENNGFDQPIITYDIKVEMLWALIYRNHASGNIILKS